MAINKLINGVVMTAAVCCIGSVLVTVGALAMPAVGAKLGLSLPSTPGYAVGARIDVPPSVYRNAPYTVVLFADRNCGVCQVRKPWLAGLKKSLQCDGSVQLVMVTKFDPSEQSSPMIDDVAYAAELGLARDAVVGVDLSALRVRVVPSLVVVDRKGIVQYAHDGIPTDEAGRTAMLAAMRSVGPLFDGPTR